MNTTHVDSQGTVYLNETAEFIEVFDASRDPALWVKLIGEEVAEAEEAADHLLKEFADVAYVVNGLTALVGEAEAARLGADLGPRAERLIRLFDGAKFFDLLDEAVTRVHRSNMSKLGDDGKPLRREDGKILKGPNYQPPYLRDLITGVLPVF